MQNETKKQIIQRRKEIETELLEMLKQTQSDFGLEDIKDIIFNEDGQDDLTKIIAMFDMGQGLLELSAILETINDAWNYFPHKCLKGLSPAEKMREYSKEEKTKGLQKPSSKTKKLTKKQMDLLWSGGGDGPYSQVNLVKQVRILDDSVSRTFLVVEAEINPTTFDLIRNNRDDKYFKNDIAVQELLDHADYRGPEFGYISMAFHQEYIDDSVLMGADIALKRARDTIIKMHKFVIKKYLN